MRCTKEMIVELAILDGWELFTGDIYISKKYNATCEEHRLSDFFSNFSVLFRMFKEVNSDIDSDSRLSITPSSVIYHNRFSDKIFLIPFQAHGETVKTKDMYDSYEDALLAALHYHFCHKSPSLNNGED